MAQWRREHPRATLTEIEDALDERLAAIRGQMLTDTALASQSASFAGAPPTERPRCPGCDARLVSPGAGGAHAGDDRRPRPPLTAKLRPLSGLWAGVSPLDEELRLLPQRYTPRLVEQMARLGTCCVSFAEAREVLSDLLGVEVIAETVRRITEAGGRQAVRLEANEAAAIKQSLAPPVVTVVDRLQQVSVDGAMVPLLHGEWGK